MNQPPSEQLKLDRRDFARTMAAASAALAMSTPAKGARSGTKEVRTFFVNLSHENHEGHSYYLVIGKNRYPLQRATGTHPALVQARKSSRLLQTLTPNTITHVVENVMLPAAVHASYLTKDPDPTTGLWGMSAIFVLPPKSSFTYAYNEARKRVSLGATLPLSAKRKKYGLPAAMTLDDLLEEQDVLDTTDWATAMVNLHPEMLCADPDTAAHIQTTHINAYPATGQLADILGCAGTALPQGQSDTPPCSSSVRPPQLNSADNPTGWATLVPYTDVDGVTPLRSAGGNTKGLILYDAKWQPAIASPWVSQAMTVASRSSKSDTTLGADVTAGRTSLSDQDLTGAIWLRNDGAGARDHSSPAVRSTDNANLALSSITQNASGYSVTASTTPVNNGVSVTLTFKNWYLRWLGLYIQFYDGPNVVPASQLPGISTASEFNTANNELFIGTLTPEFVIYGIPVQASGNSFTFTFPAAATNAKVLASGLGLGSHPAQDTETLGIVMTSVFNLSLPLFLIVFGIGAQVDVCIKTVVIPYINALLTEITNGAEGGTGAQFIAIFWRSIVRGLLNPSGPLKSFFEAFAEFLAESEITEAFVDAIPLVGAILQAIGALGALAEVTETSCEVVLSPPTYEYDLVATHDLGVTILPPSNPPGFPAAAATYSITAIFDGSSPQTQTQSLPGNSPTSLAATFGGVPLGGQVTVNVGMYTVDGSQVGHATASAANVVNANVSLTIIEDRLPIGTGTTYQHRQRTSLDTAGNHLWLCGPAPQPPAAPSACSPNAGDLCAFRGISINSQGNIGYGWRSYNTVGCSPGAAQLDQIATLANSNSGSNAQASYAATPCSMGGAAQVVYDPLGRSDMNFYMDTTQNVNVLRQIQLSPPGFDDPRNKKAWGKFNLASDDLLLHPAGAVVSINSTTSRLETLRLPAAAMTDDEAGVSLLATLHGGQGTRPGLFNSPTVSAITSDGVLLILESGNNRIHAVDIAGNPVKYFVSQTVPYFFAFSQTGGTGTQYLDMAIEFSGFIYVLSYSSAGYRLDIYNGDQSGTGPISTTMGFNAAKVTVDYWRNVYSLNYEVLRRPDGTLPAVTEPTLSQWLPTTPPACALPPVRAGSRLGIRASSRRLLRRRNFWKGVPA